MNIIQHYDKLIDDENDPFRDPQILQDHMDKWDGQLFVDSMLLDKTKRVLEIGVGTGRLAKKVAPNCLGFTGIDISPKTIERAKENLCYLDNITLICADFLDYRFEQTFDVVYSSLTLMHFENKQRFFSKTDSLLKSSGLFCLSIDKNQDRFIDMGDHKIRVFPDTLENTFDLLKSTRLYVEKITEKEFAHLMVLKKH
ncbi:MAG: class I SAM-dependent methyltransferase [Clostridia bacterium]|nr:class I SAM-dependent methyltransferase [Clostridia bacterium]